MKILMIRHGEVTWNLEKRRIGQLDSALTKRGLTQSHAIAERLSRLSFDSLYSSDLGRALQTAEQISLASGNRVIICKELRERHLGVFQGLTRAQIQTQYPEMQKIHSELGKDSQRTWF